MIGQIHIAKIYINLLLESVLELYINFLLTIKINNYLQVDYRTQHQYIHGFANPDPESSLCSILNIRWRY